jgi:hypothetical protein
MKKFLYPGIALSLLMLTILSGYGSLLFKKLISIYIVLLCKISFYKKKITLL